MKGTKGVRSGVGMDFYARRSAEGDRLLACLGEEHNLHLLTEMKGNLGDHLIWAGAIDLLDRGHVSYTPAPLSELGDAAHLRSTLLIPGSSAFNRHWHEWLPDAVLKASRTFHKVIILPSGFDARVPVVSRCLAQDNVHAFAREVRSYRSIEAFGRATLALDCAVYYHEFEEGAGAAVHRVEDDTVLVALREDKESQLPGQGLQPNPLLNRDISLSSASLDEWLAAIAEAGEVITDRLHVAVASVLLGRRLVYIDPYDAKISTYFSYTFGDAFGHLTTRCSLPWLANREYVIADPDRLARSAGRSRFRRHDRDHPASGHQRRRPGASRERPVEERRTPANPEGDPALRICAVACVKDSPELLRATMTHLALNGISDFYLYDHGSDPDLASVLSRAFRGGGVRARILRKETARFFQGAMVGVLTELARMDGFTTVLAFDADEFWCSIVPGHTLSDQIALEMTSALDALRVPVLNYVQHHGVATFRVDSLETCRYSVAPDADALRAPREQVDSGAPFVAMPFPSKVIARLSRDIRFTEGQHNITTPAGEGVQAEANGIIVRHLSLPARNDLVLKREHGLRRIEAGFAPEVGWQLQRLAHMSDEELDAYWDENSWRRTDDQRVLVGSYDRLVEDNGLVEIGRTLAETIDRIGGEPNADTSDTASVEGIGPKVLERLLEGLVDDLGTANRVLEERTDRLAECTAAVTRLQRAIADLAAEQARVLETIENSLSWRLTAPLRSAVRAVRGRRPKASDR